MDKQQNKPAYSIKFITRGPIFLLQSIEPLITYFKSEPLIEWSSNLDRIARWKTRGINITMSHF